MAMSLMYDFVMLYADLFQADEGTDENLRCVFEICTLRLQLMKVYLVEKYCVTKCDDFYDKDSIDDDDKDSIDNDDDKDSIDNDDDKDSIESAHRTRLMSMISSD
jgi:hypothetical protein